MLSERDIEIMKLLAEGVEPINIAEHLGLKPQSIRNRLSLIYVKLGGRNMVDSINKFNALMSVQNKK